MAGQALDPGGVRVSEAGAGEAGQAHADLLAPPLTPAGPVSHPEGVQDGVFPPGRLGPR
jgi:hypothetical protein